MKNGLLLILLSVLSLSQAQEEIWMRPNKGQWHDNIEFKINIPSGFLYLEKTGFTYDFSNMAELRSHEEADHHHHDEPLVGHCVKTTFIGCNTAPVFEQQKPSPFYENYILGNDSTKWVSNS